MTEIGTVFQRIVRLLEQHQTSFDVLSHDPVFTSEQAAQVRGTALSSGAKALICKVDREFLMFVMPAPRIVTPETFSDRPREIGCTPAGIVITSPGFAVMS